MFTRVDHVAMSVKDMEKVIAFYHDVIGMKKVFEREFDEPIVFVGPVAIDVPARHVDHAHPHARPLLDEILDGHVLAQPGIEDDLDRLATRRRHEPEFAREEIHQEGEIHRAGPGERKRAVQIPAVAQIPGDGDRFARLRSQYVWVDLATMKPIRIPSEFLAEFAANIVNGP